MRRFVVIGLALFLVFGFFTVTYAQNDDVVDNIEIKAIKMISVEKDILNLSILIKNKNTKRLKFTDGSLDFYMGTGEDTGKQLGEQSGYTTDSEDQYPEGILKNDEKDSRDQDMGEGESLLRFKVNLGDQALERLSHVLNCIGNPKNKPYVTIEGNFKLGMHSSKGWTIGNDLGIKWKFKAQTPNDVNLLTVQ